MSTINAAIDLGTNSFRLLIASCAQGKPPAVLVKSTKTVRLGAQLENNGKLQEEPIARGIKALQHFSKLLADFKPGKTRVCGTAALRNATNSSSFCQLVHKLLNIPVEVISAKEEVALSLAGCQAGLNINNMPILLVDSGGGSTEIIYDTPIDQEKHRPGSFFKSIPIGAVSLTEKFFKNLNSDQELEALNSFLQNTLTTDLQTVHNLPGIHANRFTMVASGGTATTLAALDLKLKSYDEQAVQGHVITRDRLRALTERIKSIPTCERNKLPALDNRRGEIILAGAMIYLTMLKQINVESFTISDWGLLEGILLSAFSR